MWWALIGIVLNVAAALFRKPPAGPNPGTLEDLAIPRDDEGARIFDFAGTYWKPDPHVAFYGDYEQRPIRKRVGPFKMKRATVGYETYLGLHLVLCRQIDALLEINAAEKEAWRGQLANGGSVIRLPELFGGSEKEGGIVAAFDLANGNPSQPINDYLASVLGPLTPAYRGVVSLIWRKGYFGTTNRLPAMNHKIFNVAGIHRGWRPDTALIGVQGSVASASIYIAMDLSGSMFFNGEEATQRAAQAAFVRSMKGSSNISVRVVGFSTEVVGSIERFDCSDDDLEDIAVFIEGLINPNFQSEDYTVAFGSAAAFFAADAALPRSIPSAGFGDVVSATRRKVLILTGANVLPDPPEPPGPAQAILNAIPGVEVFAFNINNPDPSYHANFDNTPQDGVPNVPNNNPSALTTALQRSALYWADVNPAHIIRCLWTDPMRGGIADESEIGDSFADAADLFFAEGFGLSVPFRGADLVQADRLEVERHVDAVSYRSRRTGKIEIKPIRNDYVVADLPVLDSSIVMEWAGLDRTSRGEVPNQLTVVYTKRDNGKKASVTRTNVAGVRRAGRVIPGEPVEYPFITLPSLATRVCLRDLSVQDKPLLTGTLRLAYLPPELEIGEPFIINEPLLGINNVVVRITESQEGDGRDNSVTVKILQDRYTLPEADVTGEPEIPPPPTTVRPQASPVRVVQEAPYLLWVNDTSQAEVDAALAANPATGVLVATGTKATAAHRDITLAVDAGGGYEDEGLFDFVTSAVTLTALTSEADDVLVTVANSTDLTGITANSLALIGSELVRIDTLVAAGSNVNITIGRGCLDTVPASHAIGARIIFLQNANPAETQYVAPAALDVKLLTNLTTETLSLSAAPVNEVAFNSRAIRPYPPGRFKIDGSYASPPSTSGYVLTWVERNRLTQVRALAEDHDDAGITAEVGTTYRVRVEALDEAGAPISTLTDTNVGTALTYTWTPVPAPSSALFVRFSVASVRGGYESWQRPSITGPLDISARAFEDSAEFHTTEAGDDEIRAIED